MPDGAARPAWTPRVLREADAALYVGLSPTTFRAVVAASVPPVRLSTGRIGWRREDLDRWVDGLPLATSAEMAPPVDQPAPAPHAAPPEAAPHARDPIAAALAAIAPQGRARRPAKAG
jgi:predicted DNA-binding transcriptional regulator AlpA